MSKKSIPSFISKVLSLPPHKEILYPRIKTFHPAIYGFEGDIGEPWHGQLADYRLSLDDGRSLHAREYDDVIGYHWDKVDPKRDWFNHLRRDSPPVYIAGCTLGGAGIGALIGTSSKKKDVIIKSALIGGILMFILSVITTEWD